MDELLELAERCEKATGPDRRLDAMIGAAVRAMPIGDPDAWIGGWPHAFVPAQFEGSIAAPSASGETVCHWEARAYTASLDAAMALVPEGWDRGVVTRRGQASAYVNNGESHFVGVAATPNPDKLWFECRAATEALALCAAALRARANPSLDGR